MKEWWVDDIDQGLMRLSLVGLGVEFEFYSKYKTSLEHLQQRDYLIRHKNNFNIRYWTNGKGESIEAEIAIVSISQWIEWKEKKWNRRNGQGRNTWSNNFCKWAEVSEWIYITPINLKKLWETWLFLQSLFIFSNISFFVI